MLGGFPRDPMRLLLITRFGFTIRELNAIEHAAQAEHDGHTMAAMVYRHDAGYGGHNA